MFRHAYVECQLAVICNTYIAVFCIVFGFVTFVMNMRSYRGGIYSSIDLPFHVEIMFVLWWRIGRWV